MGSKPPRIEVPQRGFNRVNPSTLQIKSCLALQLHNRYYDYYKQF